jgi:hypothetical protein
MPTLAEVAQMVVALATLVSAAAAWRTARSTRTAVRRTHDLVNGQSELLIDMSAERGRAQGLAEGAAAEAVRHPSK